MFSLLLQKAIKRSRERRTLMISQQSITNELAEKFKDFINMKSTTPATISENPINDDGGGTGHAR